MAALPSDSLGFPEALRRLLRRLTPARRRQFYWLLALMLLGAAAELFLVASVVPFLALLAGTLDTGAFGPLSRLLDFGGLAPGQLVASVAPLFIAAVMAASALRLLLSWASQGFVIGVGHDLAVEIQRRILLQPYSFHIERSTSESIAALDKIRVLVFGVLRPVMATLVAAVISLFIVALLIAVDAPTALTALAVLGLSYWLVSRVTAARLASNSKTVGSVYDERVKMVQESLGGIRELIIDQTQPLYVEEFRRIDRRLARAEATTMFIAGSPRFLIEGTALIFVAALAMILSGRDGGLAAALPVLGAIALGGLRLMPLVQQAFASWATMTANRSVIGQVLDLLALPVPERPHADAALPFRETVRLEDVSLAYPARSSPAVNRVSLEIRRGEHVGLAGETGSGKSTLADLLMGLLEPQSGKIAVDGVPLTAANVAAWQHHIAHVSQSIFLADASIARNIAFSVAEDALDMDRIRQAAGGAGIADFIDALPDGYATRVGERGVRLSGGQRQRIAIARALYKDRPLLVLDEATNALDEETEAKVLAKLFADRERTILLIAHRKSAMQHCDRVIRLSQGRLVSEGQAAARSQ